MKPVLVILLVTTLLGLAWLAWDAAATPEAAPATAAAPAAGADPEVVPAAPVSGAKDPATRPADDEEPIELSRVAYVASAEPGVRRPGSVEIHARWGDDGKPAADVQVLVLFGTEVAHDYLRSRWLRTDATGVARWDAVPAGRVTLTADRGGSRSFELPAGAHARVTLKLHEGVSVRGRVLDQGGQAVPDAALWLGANPSWSGAAVEVGRSGGDGQFELRGVRPPAWLTAQVTGLATAEMQQVVGRVGSTVKVELRLGPPCGVLRGAVVDHLGGPAREACVVFAQVPNPGKARTRTRRLMPQVVRCDEVGAFAITSFDPEMAAVLWARAPGQAPEKLALPVEHGTAPFATLRLRRGATVTGRLLDPIGRQGRLQRVRATLHSIEPGFGETLPFGDWLAPIALSDNLGDFVLPHLTPGKVTLAVGEHGDRGFATATFELMDLETRRWDQRLTGKPALQGTLQDELGVPLAQWTLVARSSQDRLPRSAVTDGDGRFALTGCEAPAYTLVVRSPHATLKFDEHRFDGLAPGPEHRLVVPAGAIGSGTILGVVRGTSPLPVNRFKPPVGDAAALLQGKPVASPPDPRARLQITGADVDGTAIESTVPIETDGRFRVERVPAGRFELSCHHEGHRVLLASVTLAAGETRDVGELTLPKVGTLHVRVWHAPTQLVEKGTLRSFRDGDDAEFQAPLQRGVVPYPLKLPPGRYSVVAATEGSCVRADAVVTSGAETRLELTLAPAAARTVRYPDDTPLHKTYFETWTGLAEGRVVRRVRQEIHAVNAAHAFVRELPPGRYRVTLTDFAGASAELEAEVGPSGDAPPIELRLPIAKTGR